MTPISILIETRDETVEYDVGGDIVGLACSIAPTHVMVVRQWDDGNTTETLYNIKTVVKVEVDSVPTETLPTPSAGDVVVPFPASAPIKAAAA